MARTADVYGLDADYPSVCVVCCRPATDSYAVERSLRVANRTTLLSAPCPCARNHGTLAERRSSAEILVSRVGAALGAAAGLLAGGMLLRHWSQTGAGTLWLNLFLAFVFAAGAFPIVWVTVRSWIAPRFTDAEGKSARNAVRIDRYWPAQDVLRLQFESRLFAGMLEQMNQRRLAGASTEE